MPRTTTIINFSAPPKLAKEINQLAKKEGKTRSELVRDALASYAFRMRLEKIQMKARVMAEKLGLETYDDIEKFFG